MTAVDLEFDQLNSTVDALRRSISNRLMYGVGKDAVAARPQDWLNAAAFAVRDRLVARWMKTTRQQYEQDVKRVYYLSMEFLIGRTFTNALLALGIHDQMHEALASVGVDLAAITELEPDAALGNGGLGRLAACFLDSMATLAVPGFGYGIRYEYGMFRQQIVGGEQVETPDYWLRAGNPWEFPRPEVQYVVHFGGRTVQREHGVEWTETEHVNAMAYDTVIPGFGTSATNTLRLWSARATEELDLSAFNQGDYRRAVEAKEYSENVSRLLYPDDSTPAGRELRLRQEYFFVSATMQDLIRRYQRTHSTFGRFAEKVAIHLNDTHPVLAIPELMRLLVDVHHIPWERAWKMVHQVFSYTNHTLMPEALETWDVDMLARLLPRHLEIIFEINANFLKVASEHFGHDIDVIRRISLVDEYGQRRVRMAHLAIVASQKVNGVSKLHSQLMEREFFSDFARMFPERFTNVTNGITPRRWLAQASPPLSSLIDSRIGTRWRTDLFELAQLRTLKDDPAFASEFRAAKRRNKIRLAQRLLHDTGCTIHPDALFDMQVKRIHEYKRQLLNVLHVIVRYNRIRAHPERDWVPRAIVFAGKAASAYKMAKTIIRLIGDVSQKVNNDPAIGDLLKVVFVPNYGVSVAELMIPAADLSEQISMAGTEASGTGNMKLALNGALTIGTMDGANIEICEAVGRENMFIFGLTASEVGDLRASGYRPRQIYEENEELRLALDQIRTGYFSGGDSHRYSDIFHTLVDWGDHYMVLADFGAYAQAQDAVDARFRDPRAWTASAVENVAGMGQFSSDRTISEYAREIWRVRPLQTD
ncbi:glycogen/starch/alpha-glucan phosphorylase [Trinickia caryophylli]|uniref:Alpha-1,4 glucan phosphorylase n=1 Tax=Trinickia caryophylli TaxID=28094 RepID=A0A1X7GE91_TRICW|nr:glycogen/starch/alpha-glucan phosphorylase [Trinickia caryophylli]PMS10797.1 glycogen/starch/alpha-glucan phosphorylase [Trinickia caryophylli]TRX13826.1 glycogen/starch/alpha-glucan phosphorylase [Trinickia caryophylli]WQE15417.1 glycogen/starch/alpha-glucan phosphorylase [Trinickia caryophylli]SMF67991.1 glycogen phosphorylase [Trinickia caryophylli]GLU33848.1 alpha-1,4 glucan phosphorylase [Trinickia caryophylli]